jgi:hypothetical protein
VAAQVVVLAAAALASRQVWILPVLAADFALRALINPCWSPLAAAGRAVVSRLPPGGRRVPFAPKRFAAGIGLLLSLSASVLGFSGFAPAAWALVGILAFFAALEAALGFCAGCVAYNGLVRLGVLRAAECAECANWSPRTADRTE